MSIHPPTNSNSFQKSYVVQAKDIDSLNHVNNVVYLQWANDIAAEHWKQLSNPSIDASYFWVCLRHEIDYLGEAHLGDAVDILTWVGVSKGVKSTRHISILKGDKLLCKLVSTWCLIDAHTKRPTRINQDILDLLGKE